jgi:hypothetical protein
MHLGLKLQALCAPLLVPSTPEALHATLASETSVSEGRNRARNGRQILPVTQLPRNHRVLYHAANLRNGANGFTNLPKKKGMLRIFSPVEMRRLRPGLNPRTRVPEASMLTTYPHTLFLDNQWKIIFSFTPVSFQVRSCKPYIGHIHLSSVKCILHAPP